ncbi:hypothetical protein LZ017_01050 [Pelomonas sp. CA6]|uniref:hypothetical protein n=1 Tax=Pelomonas sp. CA6 TaxID=2907999 RepID=UPI001F4AD2AD|nr:hypothetical protein [Pelomonas sp. CA6]MCH7341974.1 hypothetical protein [Pelomonas sp. CA6]
MIRRRMLPALLALGATTAQAADWWKNITPLAFLFDEDKAQTQPSELMGEIDALFLNTGCLLPEGIRNKIRKANRSSFVPEDLEQLVTAKQLSGIAIQKIADTSIQGVLHTTAIDKPDEPGKISVIRLASADLYASADPSRLIDASKSSFAYTLDCTGYMNAALAAGANFGAELRSTADANLKLKRSIMVARARLFSPVAIALEPALAPASYVQEPRERIDLLYAVATQLLVHHPTIPDDYKVASWSQQDLLWTASGGASALQGEAAFSVSGNAGLGVATLQSALGAGMSLSREIRFSSYNTYILGSTQSGNMPPIVRTFGAIRATLTELIQNSSPYSSRQLVDPGSKRITSEYFFNGLPRKVCKLSWRVKADQGVSGRVATQWEAGTGVCSVQFTPDAGQTAANGVGLGVPTGLKPGGEHGLTLWLPGL